jgi:hypothetical protein
MSVEYKTQIELQQKLEKAILTLNKKYEFDGRLVQTLAQDISETLFAEFEVGVREGTAPKRGTLFELKEQEDYEPIIVDVLNGNVHEIEGDIVYAKYLINGAEHEAAFDIDLFKQAGADFQGAQVRFLTVKTDDESTPYALKIELQEEQRFKSITHDVEDKLDRLEQFDKLS